MSIIKSKSSQRLDNIESKIDMLDKQQQEILNLLMLIITHLDDSEREGKKDQYFD